MKRRVEHLVSKRDGRREWLRATKLARSLAAALDAVADPHAQVMAFELASAILEALRRRCEMTAGPSDSDRTSPKLTTVEIAAAAERALWVSGRPEAAVRYAAVRNERLRVPEWPVLDRVRPPSRYVGLRTRLTFDHN